MERKKASVLSRVAMVCLSVLAGLLICAAFGAQYLKGKLLASEAQVRYTVPIRVKVTGYKASPVSDLIATKSTEPQFVPELTYKTIESSTEPQQQGEIALVFEEFSYESEAQAKTIAKTHYPVGQELTVFCKAGDFSRANIERPLAETNTASVLNTFSGISLGLALVLLWVRSQFKRETEVRSLIIRGCFTAPFLCVGLLFASWAWQGIKTNLTIDSWVLTEAVVHIRDIDVSRTGSGRQQSTHYIPRVSYSFEVDGASVAGNSLYSGSGDMYSSREEAEAVLQPYQVGSRASVYYNPEDPGQNALIKRKSGILGILISAMVALTILGSIAFSIIAGGSFRRQSENELVIPQVRSL